MPLQFDIKNWGAVGDGITNDSVAIQSAYNVAAAARPPGGVAPTVFWPHGTYRLDTPITITGNSATECEAGATITAGSAATAITVKDTNGGRHHFPIIVGFSVAGLVLRNCGLNLIDVTAIANCGDGIRLDGHVADEGGIGDNTITVQSISGCSGPAIRLKADGNACVFQGNKITVNFVTSCLGWILYDAPGLSPSWSNNYYEAAAVDPANISGSYGVKNDATGHAYQETYRSFWVGGFPSNGLIASGLIDTSVFDFAMCQSISYAQWDLDEFSSSNQINLHLDDDHYSGGYELATSGNSRATFNGGNPVWTNRSRVNITLGANLANGAILNRYFYHVLAKQQGNERFVFVPNVMRGAIVTILVKTAVANEILVQVMNVSGAPIPNGTVLTGFILVG